MPNKIGRPLKIEPKEKVCNKCDNLKNLEEFPLEPTEKNPNRRRNQCIECRNLQRKEQNKKTGYWKKRYDSMSEQEKKEYIQQKSEYNKKRFKSNPEALAAKKEYDKSDKGIYSRYKNDCNRRSRKRRGIEMLLKFEEFSGIINSPCIYCGQISRGVDRINSNESYTVENSEPCCKKCNRMKNDMTKEEFISHVKVILRNTGD